MRPRVPSYIEPYLFLDGRCEEALALYGEVLGAEVLFCMRYDENPQPFPPGTLAPGFERKVMHCTFKIGATTLMASDGCGKGEEGRPGGFRLSASFESEAEVRRAFERLAEGGSVQMEPARTFWSPCFGMLTDRFGIGWMLTVR